MSQRPYRLLPAIVLAAAILPLWGLPARSYSPYLDQVRAMYPYDFSCNVCHGADHTLNPFGQDFAKALTRTKDPYQALQAVELFDSDLDGVSNGDELHAGTLPEDRFSRAGGYKGQSPSGQPGPDVSPAIGAAPVASPVPSASAVPSARSPHPLPSPSHSSAPPPIPAISGPDPLPPPLPKVSAPPRLPGG